MVYFTLENSVVINSVAGVPLARITSFTFSAISLKDGPGIKQPKFSCLIYDKRMFFIDVG